MGYFDALTASSFKEKDDGTAVFYPWGVFGSGYELPTLEKQEQVRAFVQRYNKLVILLSRAAKIRLERR